ncbi:hypothetical protein [Streptomyces sp. KD18]|uniref:hypothetical protein n=1 Tax=Streptomyces sp. KD18 TaxID=2773452 RepID=UPI00168BED70|nr:hypothetical protein [Streptomyces sp. KD18]MBD3575488.1 hypothetical protein [Streptomyces sp. KD18]
MSIFSRSVARSGCFAAAGVLTTRSWEKPSTSAFTWRSTSGSTFAYVATFAASVGLGSAAGQEKDRVRPFFTPVSRGPVPPPEKAIDTAEALGRTFPSGANSSAGSVATQPPARRTRTVVPCRLTDHLPVGSAHVSDVSVRAATSSYGCPVSLALASAKSAALMEPSATGSVAAEAVADGCRMLIPVAAITPASTAEIGLEIPRPPEKDGRAFLILTQTPTVGFPCDSTGVLVT